MSQKQVAVSIGISAYNESNNIGKLLRSLSEQKEINYFIKEILIYSDGSTDNTEEIVKSVADPRIVLVADKNRIGKSERLNEIFRKAQGEIIVLLDADIIPSSSETINELIKPIKNDEQIGLVGGNPQPIKAKTFIEEGVNTTFYAYDKLRILLKEGNNAYGADGRILALSKKFAGEVNVPVDMIANDAFLYFSCITKGYHFRHVRKAQVWFRSPTTIKDQIRQNKRFVAAHHRMERYFGDVVQKEYAVPPHLLIVLYLLQLIRRPIHGLAIYIINLYCKIRAKQDEKAMNARWQMAFTTKKDIV